MAAGKPIPMPQPSAILSPSVSPDSADAVVLSVALCTIAGVAVSTTVVVVSCEVVVAGSGCGSCVVVNDVAEDVSSDVVVSVKDEGSGVGDVRDVVVVTVVKVVDVVIVVNVVGGVDVVDGVGVDEVDVVGGVDVDEMEVVECDVVGGVDVVDEVDVEDCDVGGVDTVGCGVTEVSVVTVTLLRSSARFHEKHKVGTYPSKWQPA